MTYSYSYPCWRFPGDLDPSYASWYLFLALLSDALQEQSAPWPSNYPCGWDEDAEACRGLHRVGILVPKLDLLNTQILEHAGPNDKKRAISTRGRVTTEVLKIVEGLSCQWPRHVGKLSTLARELTGMTSSPALTRAVEVVWGPSSGTDFQHFVERRRSKFLFTCC
jgi:hypothetical protein